MVPDGTGGYELSKVATVRLYEAVGFEHVTPASLHLAYVRASVLMRLVPPPRAAA